MADLLSPRCHLLALPPEIIIAIWQYLDNKTLKHLRLTSQTCRKYSNQPLFCSFALYPHVRSFERLIQLSETPKLARHVEVLNYNTVLLGLTEMINRRLASVYSSQISDSERKDVVELAQQLHNQNLRADAPFDELAQLSYLERVLPGLPNLAVFNVTDATGLQIPSNELISSIPSFYQQLADETCNRFEHTRLEKGMLGYPECRGGSYCRPVILSLHKARNPIKVLHLSGIRWQALFSSTDFTKNRLLVDGIFSNIVQFDLMQSHEPLFPGPLSMASLQRYLSRMVKLEMLSLSFREGHDIEVQGRGTELRDMVNGVKCQSYFSGFGLDLVGGHLPSRLNWSSGLKHLRLVGLVCSAREMKGILRHCASSLRTLELGDLVLTPEVLDGPRSCLVGLFKWMQNRLELEQIALFGTLTNGGMQHWIVDPGRVVEGIESLSAQVHHFILHGGSCPLDHVAVPPDYYDVGKRIYTAQCPECFEADEFSGDLSWDMDYDEAEEEWEDDSEWSDDGHDLTFGYTVAGLQDDSEDGEMYQHLSTVGYQAPVTQAADTVEDDDGDVSDSDS